MTLRQKQIMRLVVEGLQSKHIGARLEISERTVEWHIARIFRDLGVHNRARLVYKAVKKGIL